MRLLTFLLPLLLALPVLGAEPNDSPSQGYKSASLSAHGQPKYRDEALEMGTRYKQFRLTTAQALLLKAKHRALRLKVYR